MIALSRVVLDRHFEPENGFRDDGELMAVDPSLRLPFFISQVKGTVVNVNVRELGCWNS
jgi:hypothetical protein